MKQISLSDLDDLAVGAAILGSGGGGNPAYDLMICKQQMETFGAARLAALEEVEDDAFVVPIEFMGAPLVGIEKIPSGRELEAIINSIESTFKRKVNYLLPTEIGGANALAPLMIASKLGIPVIDGDTLGRAFPELHISSCNIRGVSPSPAFMADAMGKTVLINAPDAKAMEELCRKMTIEMGSLAGLSFYLMNGRQTKQTVIPRSITHAITLGKLIREAGTNREDAIHRLLAYSDGLLIGTGMISDIDQSIQQGFLKGHFLMEGEQETWRVDFQNEYLVAFCRETLVASTPDILTLLEWESGLPVMSESLSYGLRVALIVLPAPSIWKTPEGLALTAPHCFGYFIDKKGGEYEEK